MIKHTRCTYDTLRVAEWLSEEGIHETQIISIQLMEDGSYLIWYRA